MNGQVELDEYLQVGRFIFSLRECKFACVSFQFVIAAIFVTLNIFIHHKLMTEAATNLIESKLI